MRGVPVTNRVPVWTSQRQQVADLYSEFRDNVFRYLVSIGLDDAKAQDVTQEAFMRLYTTLRDGVSLEDPKNWVFRVAYNMAMDIFTRGRREAALPDSIGRTLANAAASPEDELIEKQWLEGLQRAVGRLSPQQRSCLELRAQGLRYREIADVLQIQISSVSKYLQRAVMELRKWNQWQS
jgi:RNA polymerase sigma-70 factor (ECF subfamily)